MMFWWLAACPKKDLDTLARRDALLKDADAAWAPRGEIGIEAASRPLLDAHSLAPTFPGVLWRIARLRTAEGLATDDPDLARSSFAEARATGASCLEGQSGFVERLGSEGWIRALEDLTVDRAPCVAWTAFPWVRWMQIQGGAAASLDLEAIDALLDRVADVQARDVRPIVVWADGLLLAVRPTWAGQDLAAARTTLAKAVDLNRGELTPLVDLYEVSLPEQQTELRERILRAPATTPEDISAKARLGAVPTE